MTHRKRIVCIVLGIVLFTSGQLLCADSMTFDLRAVASGVTRIEYRIGDDSWSDVDMESLQIQLSPPEAGSTLQLNLYGKKKKPLVTYDYRYDGTLGTFIHGEPIAETAVLAPDAETVVPESPPVAEVVALSTEEAEPVSIPDAAAIAPKLRIFDLRAVASGVTRIEYCIGDDSWSDVDMESLQIQLSPPETGSTLRLNMYGNKKKPLVTYDYRYDETLCTFIPSEPIAETAVLAEDTETVVPASSPVAEVVALSTEEAKPVSIPDAAAIAPKLRIFDLKAVASGVTRIEYRIGDDSWSDVDMESLRIQLPPPEADSTLRLNLYGKKKKPIVTYDYRYDETLGTFIHGEPIAEAAVLASAAETVMPASFTEAVVPVTPIEEEVAASSPETEVPVTSVKAAVPESSLESMETASSPDAALLPSDFWILDLNAFDSEVTRIEYRFGSESSWRDVDMATLLIPLPDPDTETNLLLRLHVKNERSAI